MGTLNLSEKSTTNETPFTLYESENINIIHSLDPEGWIINPLKLKEEQKGTLIRIVNKYGNTEAAVVVTSAENSEFHKITKMTKNALENCLYINSVWISKDAILSETLSAILYFALRRGRIWGKGNVVALVPIPNQNVPIATLLHLDRLGNVPEIEIANQKYLALAQRIKYSMHYIYDQCQGESLELIKDHFVDEILETHKRWLNRFYTGSWASSILNRTLSKEQYVSSLYNLHEYVRQTTRLAARCIAHSENMTLRNHYINHFRGEINHELLIERDLKYLGADVDYLKAAHVPHSATKEFMVVQESTVAFYQDPILMLACPLAAEGVAAHMQPDFLDALYECIESWGVKKPIEAARFLSSHVSTDGGDDGHWANVVKMIRNNIEDENHLQKFLSVLNAAMNGFEHGFNANIDDLKLWSSTPLRKQG